LDKLEIPIIRNERFHQATPDDYNATQLQRQVRNWRERKTERRRERERLREREGERERLREREGERERERLRERKRD